MLHPLEGRCALAHLGVIRAHGEEAARFLHSQLTQDFALLRPGQARLAAFCNAKGRMLANFVAVAWAVDDFLLVTPRDVLPAVLKRLSMFVLRSKVKLSDASADFDVYGLAGSAALALDEAAPPWTDRVAGPAHLVSLYPADGRDRSLWIAPAGSAHPAGTDLPLATWQWGEVRSGIAWITQPVVEAFVPQMLNYESVGGVNFKKGCYPGQEVVARSQFRGTLKRRAFVVQGTGPLQAGQEVFNDADPSQPCGIVAQAAPSPSGGWDAIASLQLSAMEGGTLHAGAVDGPVVAPLALPYELLADV